MNNHHLLCEGGTVVVATLIMVLFLIFLTRDYVDQYSHFHSKLELLQVTKFVRLNFHKKRQSGGRSRRLKN